MPELLPGGDKKESPDVETPGLLVKALISSFFMYTGGRPPELIIFAHCKYSRKKAYEQVVSIPLSGYFFIFFPNKYFPVPR
jgi:hypothetical protein